jgi:maltooligosyltrehalose trehalohydrolase
VTGRWEVWAPRAAAVEIEVEGERHNLRRDPSGWFSSAIPALAAGTRYDLVLDGVVVRPDPRARRLPQGVHGAAEVWDPSTFLWSDAPWVGRALGDDSLVYELHVGTFTSEGTFAGAAARLGHLVDLGVTHIELMPVATFDGDRGWGYDGVAIDAVHEPYGGPNGLCAFIDAAHGQGLAVLLDVVHNHLGPSGNSWNSFGPFLTDRHRTPWGDAVNLDAPGSDDVRHILISSVSSWLRDFHLDGLRLDAVHELRDDRAFHYLQELAVAVAALSQSVGRPLTLIAESDRNDPRTVVQVDQHGFGMNAQWDDDVHHALHWLLTGESTGYYNDFGSCEAVADTLRNGFYHDGRWSSFRGRTHGAPVDWSSTSAWRFVVSTQTHDQVGNRATGSRLSQLVGADTIAAGAALLLTLPYTPMLFMGEEWGAATPWQFFTSFQDHDLAAAVTKGRRSEFAAHDWDVAEIPDPQDPSTFQRSTLDWAERNLPAHAALLDWYRTLVQVRRIRRSSTGADQVDAGVASRWEEDQTGRPVWFATTQQDLLTIVNFGAEEIRLPAFESSPGGDACYEIVADWQSRASQTASGDVVLGGGGAVVLRLV